MDNTIRKISILGCGWLGLPLAVHLINVGYKVLGSTTTEAKLEELKTKGVEPYLVQVKEQIKGNIGSFLQSDLLVLNIPPGRRRSDVAERYPAEIKLVVEKAKQAGVKHLIFISSTGVYADLNRTVTEEDEVWSEKVSGQALVQCEQYLRALPDMKVTILRLAGLVGGERKPGRFLAGKTNVSNGGAPVNMVHRDDVIQIIKMIIQKEAWNETFNVCTDEHPTRKVFYTQQAEKDGFEVPTFAEGGALSYKLVANEKLKKRLDYKFLYGNPLLF